MNGITTEDIMIGLASQKEAKRGKRFSQVQVGKGEFALKFTNSACGTTKLGSLVSNEEIKENHQSGSDTPRFSESPESKQKVCDDFDHRIEEIGEEEDDMDSFDITPTFTERDGEKNS